MALPGENVRIAIEILRDICGDLPTDAYDPKNEFKTGVILLDSRIQDGYEAIAVNVKNISQVQLDTFERRKKEVRGNSAIFSKHPNGITRIGWF